MAAKISIIIPVYNEKDTFLQLLEQVEKAPLPSGMEKEIIVIDDHSTDGTSHILAQHKHRFQLLLNSENHGKGYSVKRGLEASQGDFVIIQDADLEYDTSDYQKLLAPLINGEVEVVYGSRFLGKGRPTNMSLMNWIANRFLTFWSNLFTGLSLTDMETCYKVLKREAVLAITPKLTSERFGFEPELTSLVKRYKIKELSINYNGRSSKEGKKIGWTDGFSTIYEVVNFNLPAIFRRIDWEVWAIILLVIVSVLIFLPPQPAPDSFSILEAKDVLWGIHTVDDFVPNRIMTSPVGLLLLGGFEKIFGHIFAVWFVLNSLLFALASYLFYKFCFEVFGSKKSAIVSLILFTTNYAVITFGLGYLMDMGGWAGFMGAIYFGYKYYRSSLLKHLVTSAAFIAAGGLMKEYAFFASISIACMLIHKHLFAERNWKKFFTTAFLSGSIVVVPILLVYVYVYLKFGYTYLDWFAFNETKYPRTGLKELVKVFGSLYTFGWFLFMFVVLKWKNFSIKSLMPILFVFISTLPLLVWPVTTQRIQFLVLAAPIAVSGLIAKDARKYWFIITIILALYIVSGFTMDSYLLPHVNIDEFFK